MTKVLNCLKIYLFLRELNLTIKEETSMLQFNLCLLKCYAIYQFSSAKANKAPLNDVQFLKTFYKYRK